MASPNRIAMNRVTFGTRDLDETNVNSIGWPAWVEDQLNAPPGDDPDLAAHLAAQTMRINYAAGNPERPRETWAALDEMRGLNYIGLPPAELWNIHIRTGSAIAPAERTRVRQELAAATWIRNAHSRYQLREFMVDFWHNHFNISKNEAEGATVLLPAFDKVIRENALGNFRIMLEGTATSGSMLIYLDNYLSTSTTPNENYAREIMELHTLGGAAYYGVGDTGSVPNHSIYNVPLGFTDQDVLQASRALSGWTIQYGQAGPGPTRFGNTGEFVYNSRQHNTRATSVLGTNLANLTADMAQGRAVLDTIATHPATARHVVGRLARRIFGDHPPTTAFDRGVIAFRNFSNHPDQIKQVLRAMLLQGNEIFTAPVNKVRRPYERLVALARTTDMVLTAGTTYLTALDRLTDALFSWPAPDGRPDYDSYWLATGANLAAWNLLFQMPAWREVQTSLTAQTPAAAAMSATTTVEYWVNRMVGGRLSDNSMNILIGDQAGANGAPTAVRTRRSAESIEAAYRRLVSLIATTEAFSVR